MAADKGHALAAAQAEIARLRAELDQCRQRIAELEVTEQKYRQLFESSGDSILIVDLNSGALLEANPTAARRLGYSMDELLALTLDDVEIVEANAEDLSSVSWESSFSGTQVYECRYRRKDGSLVPVEVSSRAISMLGYDILQQVVRDITRRKQIDAKREQTIRELDAFAHTVAHDLKNPIGALLNYAELLSDDAHPLDAGEIGKIGGFIQQSSRKLANIVDELLLLASVRRLDQVPREVVDMSPLIDSALWRLEVLQARYAPHITRQPNLPLALGYAPWVEEVWVNYLSNAIKYGGKPPVITIGADAVPGGMIRYWVRDNGAGIPDDHQPDLFKTARKVHSQHKDGHGLGLSIVQRIVERLGGTVGVESAPGAGSVFSFTLPAFTR
jgi:PAS domain S-box-containing protein